MEKEIPTDLLLQILDGAPKLGTLTTITCQEGAASKIFGVERTQCSNMSFYTFPRPD
jgi:hypothetical protein